MIEGEAALGIEQDGRRVEGAEDLEQLLVGRVVGQEVPEVDAAERGGGAGEGQPAAAADGDVLGAVLRGHAAPVGAVVEVGDGGAQLGDAGDRRVLVIPRVDGHRLDARRRSRQVAGLGLPLAEVAPVGVTVAVAETRGLGHDEDDAREGDGAEAGNRRWGGGHGRKA